MWLRDCNNAPHCYLQRLFAGGGPELQALGIDT
jgi:hypothetical protein